MRKIVQRYLIVFIIIFVFFVPAVSANTDAQVDLIDFGLTSVAYKVGLTEGVAGAPVPVGQIVGSVLNTVLGILGLIFFVLIVYGGMTWMTAEGNEQNVDEAKGVLKHATWGLFVVAGAYALVNFVVNVAIEAVTKR